MNLLLWTSSFFWLMTGLLSMAEMSVLCGDDSEDDANYNDDIAHFKHGLRDVCYEFSQGPESWVQAKNACRNRGGMLLSVMSLPVKKLLQTFTKDRKTNHTWWVGEGVLEEYQGSSPALESQAANGNAPSPPCTYLRLDPFHLVTTSRCDDGRGYLCTLDLQLSSKSKNAEVSSHKMKTRFARDTESALSMHVNNIEMLIQKAEEELFRMEITDGEPTDTNRDDFIDYLTRGVKKLTPEYVLENNETVQRIINCTGAILTLSLKSCNAASNPKYLFENIYKIYQVVTLLLGSAQGEPVTIKHSTGAIYQSSHAPSDLGNILLGSEEEGTYAKFPSFSAIQSQIASYQSVNTQLATFSVNPHPSTESITGTVCEISLFNGSTPFYLHDLPEMVEIFLPQSKAPVVSNSTVQITSRPIVTFFNISDANITVIFCMDPSENVSLQLLLSPFSPPNETDYIYRKILTSSEGYRLMVTPEILQQTTGVWYLEASLFNTTWRSGLSLVLTSYTTKCMYWDIVLGSWSTAGCQVGEKTTPELTHCLCNHLTLFGSSFFVMPNYVDVSNTAQLFATVSENYVVVVLLSAFYGLYLITLLWACYADRRALARRKMTLVDNSHPCAQYNYLLSIQTGHRKNAGTSANVTVKLMGSEGKTEIHNLTDCDKPVFERKAVDMFLLATPFPLGELQNMRLQHDNTGGHPSWFINKVTVQDLQTRQVWHFLCDAWLSADRGDGLTKRNFNPAKKKEIASFRNIFQSRTSTGFRDEHIWVSIVDPPWRSPFTRAQRVSCCMSLLLCTMAINIAFWNIPKDANSPVIISTGFLEITWQEVIVGVESGLLMFPINILIITIFRSIKPRVSATAQKNSPAQDVKPRAVTIPTILKETEELVCVLSKSARNKIQQPEERLVSACDLCVGLESVHGLIQLMQGESESDPHWHYCSQFVLSCLCRLSLCLEQVDVKAFPSQEEHQQAINLTNVLLRKAEMVFTSHMTYCPRPVYKKSNKSSCWLPWWCVFLGWFLLLSISGVSTYFTLLYGFQYGREKSIKWVISLGLSLFQSIFILQPLKVIGLAIFFALLLKPASGEESEEVDEVLLEQKEKRTLCSGGRDALCGRSS